MTNKLIDFFPELSYVENAELEEVNYEKIDGKVKRLRLKISSSNLISAREIVAVERYLKDYLEVLEVTLYPKFPKEKFSVNYLKEIAAIINSKPQFQGMISETAAFSVSERDNIIYISTDITNEKAQKTVASLVKLYFDFKQVEFDKFENNQNNRNFDEPQPIEIYYAPPDLSPPPDFIPPAEYDYLPSETPLPKSDNTPPPEWNNPYDRKNTGDDGYSKRRNPKRSVFSNGNETVYELPFENKFFEKTAKLVYSKEKITTPPTSLKDLENDVVSVIWGEVFDFEKRVFTAKKDPSKQYVVFNVDITDGNFSYTVKIFDNADKADEFEFIKKGNALLLKGTLKQDDFAKCFLFEPSSIAVVEKKDFSRKDTAEKKRVELHLHTKMSTKDGVSNPSDLVNQAFKWGHRAVAITDHGNVQAFPEVMNAVEKIKKHSPNADFKVIYGVEGYLINEYDETNLKNTKRYHIIILVKNQIGLKNLYKLVSYSYIDYFYKHPLIPRDVLIAHREGLIIGAACEQGELFRSVFENDPAERVERIAKFYDYLEVQPIGNNFFMLRNRSVKSENELREINKKIINLGEKLNIPVCATGDVHFLNPEDCIFREIVELGMKYDDADKQPPLYFRPTDDMFTEFEYIDREKATEIIITNPNKIADEVEVVRPIPLGTFTPKIDGAEEELRNIVWSTAKSLYGETIPGIVRKRTEKEVDAIIKYGFSVLYMIAQKLVSKSNELGYLVGSRGSVGSSIVAYFLGISEVNALPPHYLCPECKYSEFTSPEIAASGFDLPPKKCPNCNHDLNRDGQDIPFETFLGFKGDKAPDIDLNFSGDVQSKIHRYTEELFGKDKVFKAGTIQAVQEKTAYPWVVEYAEKHRLTLNNAEIKRLENGCCGIKSTTGQHPGGMVVCPSEYDIYDFTPIQHPPGKNGEGIIATHFDFHAIHDTILKLDELGHDVPTLYKYLQDETGCDIAKVPPCDAGVLSLFTGTDSLKLKKNDKELIPLGTFGLPEFGTRFVMGMLEEAKPKCFSDLLQISGLSHGTDVWLGNAQELIKDGICTISEVIGTRDDIMVYLMHKGVEPSLAFKIMEITRKGNAKKLFDDAIYDAFKANNIPEWYVESCKKIKYMFPKAHAAAYVTGAVKLGWFKVHRPAYFYAATLIKHTGEFDIQLVRNNDEKTVAARIREINAESKPTVKEENEKDALLLIYEMFLRGIKFLPPKWDKSGAVKYIVDEKENGIRLPFTAIDKCGEKVALRLKQIVDDGKPHFVDDLIQQAGINSTLARFMKDTDVFEGLSDSAQVSLFDY